MDVRRRWGVRAATAAMAFALTLRAAAGHAAIAVESTSSASAKAASSLTWSHTVSPSPNRILMVGVSNNNTTRPVSSVTYGGTALTRIGFQNAPGTQNRMELWSLIAPSPGTANVVVTFSGSVDSVGGAIVFSGVDQATPLGTFASANGSNASPSVTVSSASGQVVIDTLATNGDGSSAAARPGQTQRWSLKTGNGGGDALGTGSTEPGPSAGSMSGTLGHGHAWSIGAVPLQPGAACGDGTTDSGEDCDLGAGNGTPGSCCTAFCQFASSATVCRAAAGVCDVAESCTGTSATCPADAKSAAVCRPVAGPCDVAESCDGVNDDCPADTFQPATVECRAAAGVCDVAESCDGTNAACPPDAKSTAICRATAGVCDVAE